MASGSNNDSGGNGNVSDLTAALNTTLLALAKINLSLQNSKEKLSTYDGTNGPPMSFLQDEQKGGACASSNQENGHLRAVSSKFLGPDKGSAYEETPTMEERLHAHRNQRFVPGKGFFYYYNQLYSLRMKPGDTVGSFKDQIEILLDCIRSELKEITGQDYREVMMTSSTDASIDIFIRGLPGELGLMVDLTKPTTLDAAYQNAVRLEARIDAGIIPDIRIRSAHRAPIQDDFWGDRRSETEKRMTNVGWIQEQDNAESWDGWDAWNELPEEPEYYEEWPGPLTMPKMPPYENYYQPPQNPPYPSRNTQYQHSEGAQRRLSYAPPVVPPARWNGYDNTNVSYAGPWPAHRCYLAPSHRTYDPDHLN